MAMAGEARCVRIGWSQLGAPVLVKLLLRGGAAHVCGASLLIFMWSGLSLVSLLTATLFAFATAFLVIIGGAWWTLVQHSTTLCL